MWNHKQINEVPKCCLRVSQVCNLSLFISSSHSLPLSLISALKIEIVLIWNCKLANEKSKKNTTINQLAEWEGILGAWAALPIGHWQALNRSQAGRYVGGRAGAEEEGR